ncbi:MAG: DNA-binding protein [Candidatus Diapherotrites archaeon]|nr:DNA-binding protein [Candidatus Diapherotrites archaeon]
MTEKNAEREQAKKEMEAQMRIESMLRKVLTDEARQRLYNVRLVNKELYTGAIQSILMLLQQGQLEGKVSDSELKSLLENLGSQKKEFTIRRK